ncbi:MAG: HD domain-containing protein [Bacillota bacterium]|jgi:putative nucleotidyltransferase with HDIG domain|nr:HD domain-containing protein [Bacillota bacterium]HHT91844.1 HD domain-containing protein [Bacillota bacterium]
MNRIESVREVVDQVLSSVPDPTERRAGYVHLYGVAQACALLASKRGEDVELAVIAGVLHDIHSYSTGDPKDHASKGAVMAREILSGLQMFTGHEIEKICGAIHYHSNKDGKHAPFVEVLIDADVMQHSLYNPLFNVFPHERQRYDALRREFSFL